MRLAAIALLATGPVAVTATHTQPGLSPPATHLSPVVTAVAPPTTAAVDDRAPTAATTATTAATTTTTTQPPYDPWSDLAPGWEARRGEAALARVDYPWQSLGYSMAFEPARPGYLGLTDPVTRTVTVWVRPELTQSELVSILAHELGHVVDLVTTTPEERGRYLDIRQLPGGGSWDPCDSCEDYRTVAGDWAESFAEWLVGPHGWRSMIGPPPDATQLAQLAPLFSP